ncbi:hypothetical protein [Halosegnis marinus]|uniref:hypothetical protein n=1 Tax=Halosegnis marinus TaxID=3034023 RepID=UPI003611E626
MEQSYREVARERVRTPQAYLAPVVAALVVWLAVVASNVVYVAGGVLLLATVVAVSVDGVSPRSSRSGCIRASPRPCSASAPSRRSRVRPTATWPPGPSRPRSAPGSCSTRPLASSSVRA